MNLPCMTFKVDWWANKIFFTADNFLLATLKTHVIPPVAGCDVSCLTTLLEANWKQNYTKKSLQCYALLLLFFFFQGLSKPNVDTSFFCPKNRQNASASRVQHNSWERQQNKKPHGIASFLDLDFINYTQQIKCHLFQAFSKQIHLFYFQKFAWLEFGFFFSNFQMFQVCHYGCY